MCKFRIYRDSDACYIAFLYIDDRYSLSKWTDTLIDAITHVYEYHDIKESYYTKYYEDLCLIFEASYVPSITTLVCDHPELSI